MGNRIEWHCPTCGYQKQLQEGTGWNGCNKRVMERTFPEEKLRRFQKQCEDGKVASYMMELRTAYCKHCKELTLVEVLHYTDKSGMRYEVQNSCRECGSEVELLNDKVSCPKCKSEMKKEKIGRWD